MNNSSATRKRRFDLFEAAQELLYGASYRLNHGPALNPQMSRFVIREEVWHAARAELASRGMLVIDPKNGTPKNELLGIPVRLTVGDAAETPAITLVLEVSPVAAPPMAIDEAFKAEKDKP